jgi:hypothetical protein
LDDVDIARLFEGAWLVVWAVAALWLLCLLGARSGIPALGAPWRAQMRLRRRLRHAGPDEVADLDGFTLGTDAHGRPCYLPEPGVHVYGVGHRHPISQAPRVCVRRLDGEAVFCDRAGRPLRRLPAGLAGADPDLYLPLDVLEHRTGRFARPSLQELLVEEHRVG